MVKPCILNFFGIEKVDSNKLLINWRIDYEKSIKEAESQIENIT